MTRNAIKSIENMRQSWLVCLWQTSVGHKMQSDCRSQRLKIKRILNGNRSWAHGALDMIKLEVGWKHLQETINTKVSRLDLKLGSGWENLKN